MLFTALLILISTPAHGGEVKLRDHDQKIYTAADIVRHQPPAWVQESRHNLVQLLQLLQEKPYSIPTALGNIIVEYMEDGGYETWFPHVTINNTSRTPGNIMHIIPLSQGKFAAAWGTTYNEHTIITVYDAAGNPLHTLQPDFEAMHLAACSRGTNIAASCSGGGIKMWKLMPNKARLRSKLSMLLSKDQVHENQFLELQPHRLVTGNYSTLQLWDTQHKKCLATALHDKYITTPLVKLSTEKIAVGCCTGSGCAQTWMIMLWNITTGNLEYLTSNENNRINTIVSLPEGLLATTSYIGEKIVNVWDTNEGELLHTLRLYYGYAYSLCALSNGTLASGEYNFIDIWNPVKGELMRTLYNNSMKSVDTLLELPYGRLAAGGTGKSITIWDCVKGVCLQTLGCSQDITTLKLLSDRKLLSADKAGEITIWNSAIDPTEYSPQKSQSPQSSKSYCLIS